MSSSTFSLLGVPDDLSALLAKMGAVSPFPIQAVAIPDALAGRDVSGRAPTGSGKTLAFGIPLVLRTSKASPRHPQALVLVPTRELAAQVRRDLQQVAAARNLEVACVYGGAGYEGQIRALRRGVDVLVACPGRLEDLISRNDVALDEVRFVVVDEADRMADMGFLPSVRRLLDQTCKDRQTLLFSATLDGEVDVLVRGYQRDPCRYEVGADESLSGEVRHMFWRAAPADRARLTAELVSSHAPTMVFCRTRHGADRLTRQLSAAGLGAVAIHGSRSQPQRERALAAFAAGRVQALVATDVAARGIHVDDVTCVIHYDPPGDHKDYLHRSGRTGRAGADGMVISLVSQEHSGAVRSLQRVLGLPQVLEDPDDMMLAGSPGSPRNGHLLQQRRVAPGAPSSQGPARRRRSAKGAPADRFAKQDRRAQREGANDPNGSGWSAKSPSTGQGRQVRQGSRKGNSWLSPDQPSRAKRGSNAGRQGHGSGGPPGGRQAAG